MRRLWGTDSTDYGSLRAGRFWVPFGNETIWFHADQNPLISYSAAFPWGLDEGLEVYGSTHGIDWIASVTAGTFDRNSEDSPEKTWNLKLSGRPWKAVEVTGSFMLQGSTAESAIDFGGSHMDPVGSDGSSSAGTSPSEQIEATLGEVDMKLFPASRASIGLTYGLADIDDDVDAFDRSFQWFRVEPRYEISPSLYAVLRYSEIGTYDSNEGYHFDGLMIADAEDAFGYDVQRFQRIAAGIGWRANPNTLLKFEVGRDRFWVIDASPADPDEGNRTYFGASLVVSF